MVPLSKLELISLISNFFLMYALFNDDLTVLFFPCLFRVLRKSGSADVEMKKKIIRI